MDIIKKSSPEEVRAKAHIVEAVGKEIVELDASSTMEVAAALHVLALGIELRIRAGITPRKFGEEMIKKANDVLMRR